MGGSGTGLKDNTTSFVEVVFDEFSDIGVTGIPERMVDDVQTYQNSGDMYGFHLYGLWSIGNDVYLGDTFKFTGDLYCSKELRDAGEKFTCICGQKTVADNGSNQPFSEQPD